MDKNKTVVETACGNRQCFARLFSYARRYRWHFVLAVLLGLIASGAELGQVHMLKQAVETATGKAPMGLVLKYVGLIIGFVAIANLADTAHIWRMSVTSQRLVLDLQNDVHRKIHTLSEKQISEFGPGELAHLALQDSAAAQQSIGLLVGTLVRQPATLLAMTGYLIYLDWKTAMLALSGYCLVILLIRLLARNLKRQAAHLQESRASIQQRFLNLLAGRDLLRCFDTSGRLVESLPQANDTFHYQATRYLTRKCTVTPISRTIGITFALVIICYTAWRLRLGIVSPGTAAASAGALILFYQPIARLAGFGTALLESLASAQRVFDFMSLPSYWDQEKKPSPVSNPVRSVEFIGVNKTFSKRDFCLQNLNFQLKPGQIAMIVGPSGSGKTTLIKMLMASLQPTGGIVLINGTSTAQLSKQWLHEQLAYLPQDCPVIGRTIEEEITLGHKNVSVPQMEEVARQAELLEWVSSLPKGWQTPIGYSGMCISGGQQQRLGLARLFMAKRTLYVVDEPTAHLDQAIENIIIKHLCRHIRAQKGIGVIVSHRQTLIKHVDLLLSIQGGTVADLSHTGCREDKIEIAPCSSAAMNTKDVL